MMDNVKTKNVMVMTSTMYFILTLLKNTLLLGHENNVFSVFRKKRSIVHNLKLTSKSLVTKHII